MIKKLISLVAAVSMAAAAMTNVFALEYGEEWGGSTSTPTVTATAVPSNQNDSGSSDAVSYGTYKDVPTTHWAYNAVERCSASKWFSGYPDGTFRPDGEITRAEAMKVFVTFLGEPLPEDLTSTSYYDVEIDDWYAPYIEAGKDLFPPRTSMTSQPKFQPDMPITREDTVYALVNALNYDQLVKNADESVLNMFSDQNSISEVCRGHMAVAVSNELVSGYDNGTIGAQDPLTRAQFATLLYRATFIGALEETEKKLVKVDIEPSTLKEIIVGESFEITATATYSDGSTEDYTSQLNPYTDSQEGIVTINKNKVTGVSEGTVLINYNNDVVADQSLVVNVKPDPNAVATPEPTAEPTPTPEPDPEIAGSIEGQVDKEEMPASVAKRYTVLVIDVSGSMYGSKMEAAKEAAKDFCTTVLSKGAEDHIAVVGYDNTAEVVCDFTTDSSQLTSAIGSMYANGGTNFHDAFSVATSLLDEVTDSDVLAKSMVFLTDGYPEHGPTQQTGKYTSSDFYFYDLANAAYEVYQQAVDKNYDVYSIGFQTNSDTERFLKDIQNKGYYSASNATKIYSVFDKIANTIVVSGVNVDLKDGDTIIDSCSTNKGAVTFKFTVNPGVYTLSVSAPGYITEEQSVEIESGETLDVGDICLELEN